MKKEPLSKHLDYGDLIRNAFTTGECEKILRMYDKEKESEGLVGTGKDALHNTTIRKSGVNWLLQSEKTDWIFDRVEKLLGVRVGMLQFSRYHKGHYYNWHVDQDSHNFKFIGKSLVVQVSSPSSYKGGELEFKPNIPCPKDQGTAVVFRSYITHRVSKVESGDRYSLVAWV